VAAVFECLASATDDYCFSPACSGFLPAALPVYSQVPHTLDEALESTRIAHLYGVQPFLDQASDSVIELTDTATAVRVWAYAMDHLPFSAGSAMASHAATVVLKGFDEILGAGKLHGLANPCVEFLVRSNDLVVASETSVMKATIELYDKRTSAPAVWFSYVRWGRLSRAYKASHLGSLRNNEADSRARWVPAYTTGLLDALTTYVDDGLARLRPSNFPRGGASRNTIEMGVTLKAGDAEQLSEPLLVAADNWRLVINARDSGNEHFSTHVPVTLRREATCPVAEAAGVRSAEAVRVKARLYIFGLLHGHRTMRLGANNGAGTFRTEELRRMDTPPDEANGQHQAVHFLSQLRRDGAICRQNGYEDVTVRDGRIGVGVAFGVIPVEAEFE